jgi:hypothetical protein
MFHVYKFESLTPFKWLRSLTSLRASPFYACGVSVETRHGTSLQCLRGLMGKARLNVLGLAGSKANRHKVFFVF